MTTFIVENRAIVEAANIVSRRHSIEYVATDDEWVVRLQDKNKRYHIYAYNIDSNDFASASIASDKAATYAILKLDDVKAVPHHVLKSVVTEQLNAERIAELLQHGDIVVKPLHGTKGRSICKITTVTDAISFMGQEDETLWVAAPYLEIDHEIRTVVYDGAVVLAYRKYDPVMKNGVKMFNASLGAKTSSLHIDELPEEVRSLAVNAATSTNLRLCAVDIIVEPDGSTSVLEINSGFSLERFALTNPDNRRKVVAMYVKVLEDVFNQ